MHYLLKATFMMTSPTPFWKSKVPPLFFLMCSTCTLQTCAASFSNGSATRNHVSFSHYPLSFLTSLVSDPDAPDNIQTTQSECVVLIKRGLRKCQTALLFLNLFKYDSTGMITNIPNLGMNYANYKTSIVQKYHVQLLGWPSDIPFANPHQITTAAAAKSLQNALSTSTCKWVAMSKRQQKEHTIMLAAEVEGGQVIGKKRKVCSDKGKRRGKPASEDEMNVDDEDNGEEEANNDNDENEQPTPPKKKKKTSGSLKKPTLPARKPNAAASSSKKPTLPARKRNATASSSKKSKATAAKKTTSVAKRLPPAALKSKEFIDSEDDSDV